MAMNRTTTASFRAYARVIQTLRSVILVEAGFDTSGSS